MKIVLLSLNFGPELTGIGKYSTEMAHHWVDAGHEVDVVCAPPYYPEWRVRAGWSARRFTRETPRPGLTVHRCPLWVPSSPSGLKRLLHLFTFALSSLPMLLRLARGRPDVVFCVVPAFFCAPGAWLAARLAGAQAWLHVQDFELDAAFELGLLKGQLTRRIFAGLERRMMARFDTVSTISRRMMRQLAAKGLPLEKSELLPNWVDLKAVYPMPVAQQAAPRQMRAELQIRSDQIVFLFSGTMNRKQGLPYLLGALDLLRDRDDIVLVLCGSGEYRTPLERELPRFSHLRVLDLQPVERLNVLLNMADVHLLPQLKGAADLVMPSKLGGMLASGRPVIAASRADTEVATLVRLCGLLVEPEDPPAMAAAMRQLADAPELRKRQGLVARRIAEEGFGQDHLLGDLERALAEGSQGADSRLPLLPLAPVAAGRLDGLLTSINSGAPVR